MPDRPTTLQNKCCAYCGAQLSKKCETKDHVVARSFVPKNSMNGSWNLVVKACVACNGIKSALEDDISAVTMAHHQFNFSTDLSDKYKSEANRKGHRSVSKRTGKRVSESIERLAISSQGSAISLSGSFTCPPQIEESRAFELARMQVLGFFYFLTYKQNERTGHYWRGKFFALNAAIRADWGNDIQRHFMNLVATWDYRLITAIANESFKASIRKHPEGDAWSWALEWNESLRLIGFFGDEAICQDLANSTPKLQTRLLAEDVSSWFRYRIDTPLDTSKDVLFKFPEIRD